MCAQSGSIKASIGRLLESHRPLLEQLSPTFGTVLQKEQKFDTAGPFSPPIFDIKQAWETSFGTSTPVFSPSLRAFVSPSHFFSPRSLIDDRLTTLLSRSHVFLRISTRYLLGRLLGADLAQIFLGFCRRNFERLRRIAVSPPSTYTSTLEVLSSDRIGR